MYRETRKRTKRRQKKYLVNSFSSDRIHKTTKPLTPSFVHRIQRIEEERSKETGETSADDTYNISKVPNDPAYSKSITINELFDVPDVTLYRKSHSTKFGLEKNAALRSQILKSIDSAVMALFSICDIENRGTVDKNLLVKRLYCSAACKLVRQSKPLRHMIRRKGFCKEIIAYKCRESNQMCFDEFYSLSFQEAREKEKREQEKKKRADELRKLKRLQKLRDAAHARRRKEEEKKLKHALDMKKLELNLTKKHSMDTRIAISRNRAAAKVYVEKLNHDASKKAVEIMGDAADKSQQKLEITYKDVERITSKSNKNIKAMYAEAETNIQLMHEKAEKEINKRWEHEKRSMAQIRKEMYRVNNEAVRMFEEEKLTAWDNVRKDIDKMKTEARIEVKLLKEQALREADRIRQDGMFQNISIFTNLVELTTILL